LRGGIGENIFIEGNMTGDEDTTRGWIKTVITFVIIGKTEMNARKRAGC
jgi:hypothetical protein